MKVDELAALLETLPEAVVVLDEDVTIRWANQAAERMFGFVLADVFEGSALDLVHPDDAEFVLRSLSTVQDKTVGSAIEVRIQAIDGWRLVELVGAPHSDGSVVLCLRDVTQRRLFEVAHDDEARFRSLVHNAGVVTMLLSPSGIVHSVSGAMTRLTGHDPEHVEGAPLEQILAHPSDRVRLRDALSDTQPGTPTTVVVEMCLFHSDAVAPIELTIVNLLEDPTVSGFVVSGHDVSERVAVEHELRGALSLLNATLDSTADGILVVDGENNITSFNQRFVDMWRIPTAIIETREDQAALGFVLDQLANPDAFIAKVNEVYAKPDAESNDMLDFKDGRVFERLSRPQRVDGAVVGRVWSFRDLTERKRLEDELVYRAFHDPLTGLPNKAKFCDRLQHAADRSRRTATDYAVLFCDLDNFKTVNDSLGHQAGDDLLINAAAVLSECLRAGDTAARLGGDEFAILIEDLTDVEAAAALAGRITQAFRTPLLIGRREVNSTVSVGIALGSQAGTIDQLLSNADLAMYVAKSRGKNRYEHFAPEQHEAVVVRIEVEADLHRALDRDELTLFYQPIVDTNTEAIVAVEALVRWDHPERGLLLPGTFIPLAEEAGLMDAIGSALLLEACHAARVWNVSQDSPIAVAVNVSSRQLAGDRVLDDVARALELSGLDPTALILEITETAMLQDTAGAQRNLDALSAMGLRLALDDFGTGYSSLTHLQQFPIDILKIDKSFVATIADRATSTLGPAIIQLASSLGLITVAEGVENPDQLRRLRELECQLVQGFWLHRPLSAARLNDLLTIRAFDTQPLAVP